MHLIFILCDSNNGILENLLNLPYCFYTSLVLITLSLILFFSNILNTVFTVILSLIGTLSLFVLFIICRENDEMVINPVSLIINYISIPCLIFIVPIFYKQSNLILCGLTVKQYQSILIHKKSINDYELKKNELLDADNRLSYINKLEQISFCGKLKNLKNFILYPIPESLIRKG
jgi:hypothetical protein